MLLKMTLDQNSSPSELYKKIVELEERLETYSSIVNHSPDLFYRTDLNGIISFISPSALNVSGYTVEEAVGMNMAEEVYVFPEERKKFLEELAKSGEVRNFIAQLKRKDGSVWWASTNAHFLKDNNGNVIGVIGITRDISDIKEKENALQESEERFRHAFHTNPDSINLNALSDGLYIDINEGFTELTGYTREEVIGKTSLSLNIWNDAKDRKRLVDELTKTGKVDNLEAQFVRKNGEIVDGLMSARLLQINNETVIQSVTKDITEIKQLQKQILQSQKLEAIGTLAGGIAHDFNNILGGIFGYAQLIMLQSKENEKIRNYVDKLFAASDRARRLVGQILDFSRRGTLEKIPSEIGIIIKEALKLIRVSLPSSIEIRQNIRSNLGIVKANPEQIHQVVMNLCINASHAMQENGGLLSVELNPVLIYSDDTSNFKELPQGKYLMLTVTDNGNGMDKETVSRIFQPFFTTKEIGVGTGMGLATVQRIVKNHGGEIKVYSDPGAGTTFQILLPVVEGKAKSIADTALSLPKGSERILFIDDEDFLTEIGKDMLEKLGYKVQICTNPVDALKVFQKNPKDFDLIITDLTMPKMTGENLAKEIKKIRKNIPIVLCTGFNPKIESEHLRETGINSILTKPVTLQNLATTLRKVLDE